MILTALASWIASPPEAPPQPRGAVVVLRFPSGAVARAVLSALRTLAAHNPAVLGYLTAARVEEEGER